MDNKPETMKIDDVEYIRKDSVGEAKTNTDGLQYAIIRCDRSGVYAGYISKDEGSIVEIREARKLWYWSGAASLSQLAMEGVSNPSSCKFPMVVPVVSVRDCIEIIPATTKCFNSISGVSVWGL